MTEKGSVPGLRASDIDAAASAARAVAAQALEDARELSDASSRANEQYSDAMAIHRRIAEAAAVVAQELERVRIGGEPGDERGEHE
jgi:hypothetical protein